MIHESRPRTRYQSPLVKICGITNVEDALYAAECGAELLGFNFYPKSPRYIRPEEAASMIRKLPESTTAVGVFVNEAVENILNLIDLTGIKIVQLHGDEDVGFVLELCRTPDIEVIKALRVRPGDDAEQIPFSGANAILLDGYSDGARGGTGKKIDWQLAYEIGLLHGPIYLAGGLTADNVQEAIRKVRPFGVDACSGLESSPGKKDTEKVEAFIRNAKNA